MSEPELAKFLFRPGTLLVAKRSYSYFGIECCTHRPRHTTLGGSQAVTMSIEQSRTHKTINLTLFWEKMSLEDSVVYAAMSAEEVRLYYNNTRKKLR